MPPIAIYHHANNLNLLPTSYRQNGPKRLFLALNPPKSWVKIFDIILEEEEEEEEEEKIYFTHTSTLQFISTTCQLEWMWF